MRTPKKPLELMVKATRERLTRDEQLQLISYTNRLYDIAHFNEGVLYQTNHDKEKLEAENRFLIKLFNIKTEEQ